MSISIKEIMKKDYSKLSSSDSVESAVELIEKRGVDYLLVEEQGEIKGVVTSHELVGYPSSRLLVDCRIKPIATMSEETWLNEALKVLEEKEVNFLVVLNKEGSPIGVINKEIILSFLYQEVKKSNKEKGRGVTERKRAEEALQASETEKKSILNAISDVVVFQDKSLSIR
ncbi:MAG: CBS domain-containing protein, partial [Proteobacteria bacterium]|nr:CBS domain-containing protein [Pseudomonadota bacterium]